MNQNNINNDMTVTYSPEINMSVLTGVDGLTVGLANNSVDQLTKFDTTYYLDIYNGLLYGKDVGGVAILVDVAWLDAKAYTAKALIVLLTTHTTRDVNTYECIEKYTVVTDIDDITPDTSMFIIMVTDGDYISYIKVDGVLTLMTNEQNSNHKYCIHSVLRTHYALQV